MGVGIFLILFALGVILSTVGGLIGLVDAFRVSPVWGLLSFFVPFALLVFCIKFWGSRKWAKISLITSLVGLLSMLAGVPFMAGFVRQQIAALEDQAREIVIEIDPDPMDPDLVDPDPIDIDPEATDQGSDDQPPGDQEVVDQEPLEAADPNFATPMVPAAPQLANIASAELIRSTDPEERVRQINSRRPDPFATVPIPPPPVVVPPPPAPTAPTAPTGATPIPGGIPAAPTATAPPGGTAATPTPTGPGTATPQSPGAALPPAIPEEIVLAPLPALPEPTQAQAVTVTGVVTIGDRNYAIVQSPDDPTGRYVTVGQRLAGGSVLVKRIDMRGSEPVVVLEQNGVEVPHAVGVQETAETPAAT